MYHSFCIHSSVNGHLGYFHILAIAKSAVMNIGVHVSLSVRFSKGICPVVIVTYIFTTMLPYSFVTMIQVSWGNWRSLKLLKKEGRVVCFQNLSSSCVYGQIRGNMWERLELLLESLHFSIKKPQKSCHSLLAWRVSIERSAVILMGIPLCVYHFFSFVNCVFSVKLKNFSPTHMYHIQSKISSYVFLEVL